jgi:hypothetical protein
MNGGNLMNNIKFEFDYQISHIYDYLMRPLCTPGIRCILNFHTGIFSDIYHKHIWHSKILLKIMADTQCYH